MNPYAKAAHGFLIEGVVGEPPPEKKAKEKERTATVTIATP